MGLVGTFGLLKKGTWSFKNQPLEIRIGNPIDTKIFQSKNKNNLEPISGEIWLDELRLSQVRKDAGNAMRVQSRIGIADIASSTISYSRKNGDFHVLQERLGTGNTEGKFRADTRFQLHKFFPTRWGIKVPVNFSYSQNVSTPKYLPGTDIRLFHQEAPDSVINQGDQFNFNTSFSNSETFFQEYAGMFAFFAIFKPKALGLLETTKLTFVPLSIIAFKLEPFPLKRTAILCII